MKLPSDSIGITDTIGYRECPRRMSYGLRRHIDDGLQSEAGMPEVEVAGAVWARGYGSAIHAAIQASEEGFDDDAAIQKAWNAHGSYLEPGDLPLLHEDLEKYRERDYPNTRTIASEDELKVPLMKHEGRMIYFRFKLDRLYERLDAPGVYIHVDYKSSKWAKSEKEVHEDLQLWAYNWGIHTYYPECDSLQQTFDQLRYGQIPTSKSAEQRTMIHEWLKKQVTAIIEDEDVAEDGLLEPKYNDWCPWCPIMESCDVVDELTDFSLVRLLALAPQEKVGRKTLVDLDPLRIDEYADEHDRVRRASQVLKRFDDSMKNMIKELPEEERERLRYELDSRKKSVFPASALREMHARLGDRFYDAASISKTAIAEQLKDDPDLREWALSLAVELAGPSVLKARASE